MSSLNARKALVWAGGVQIVRDVAQFAAMLVLVRLLSPEQYGAMALAQAILGIATLFAAGAFVPHALQARDPDAIDWQSHFTAGTIWNTGIALVLLAFSAYLVTPVWGTDVGLSLTLLALALVFGGPAEVRNAMLCARHDWARFRVLSLLGTILGLAAGIGLGFTGFGVVALAIQPAMYVLPAAVDLFWSGFKPTWDFDRIYYRDVIKFGLNRFSAGSLSAIRGFVEQSLMAMHFSLATNGEYNRSVGLSNLLAGRFGPIAVGALYPILTRQESHSPKFRRNAARVLQGVAWSAIPAGAFLAIEAADIVTLFYGGGWSHVTYLLPPASAMVITGALNFTLSRLLLANESRRLSLMIDAILGFIGIGLAFLYLPRGPSYYLWTLSAAGIATFSCGLVFLIKAQALELKQTVLAVVPPLPSTTIASLCTLTIEPALDTLFLPLKVGGAAVCFGLVYLGVLLIFFNRSTVEMLNIFPGAHRRQSKRSQ